MVQGGTEHRLEKAIPTPTGLRGPSQALGCGTDIFLALSQPPHEQRLREVVRHRRVICLRSHDPPYGQEAGPRTLQLVRETGTTDIPKTAALKACHLAVVAKRDSRVYRCSQRDKATRVLKGKG